MRYVAMFIGCMFLWAGASGDAGDSEDPLSPLRFLVGSCWEGTFPDGKSVDTHCFEVLYGDAFIRDTHIVLGPNPDYRGETIYHWDSEGEQITYRYWNSLGGVSDGVAIVADGKLFFPGERHVGDDGSVSEYQSVIERVDNDRYVSGTEEKTDTGWTELWRIEFVRRGSTP